MYLIAHLSLNRHSISLKPERWQGWLRIQLLYLGSLQGLMGQKPGRIRHHCPSLVLAETLPRESETLRGAVQYGLSDALTMKICAWQLCDA
jgi:hypothetical protein